MTQFEEKLLRLRKKAMALPLSPGVYIIKNNSNEIIYIGKAKALKNRVSQYFGAQHNLAQKVRQMVFYAENFDYIITDSEFEALVLENSLIKQHKPKYNILLKDDKGYSYVKITKEPWRRISVVFQKDKEEGTADYIGPYNSHFAVNQAFLQAVGIFRLPTCTRKFPKDFKKERPCLNYYIKRCSGVCRGNVPLAEYNESVDGALDFLRGGSGSSLQSLTEQMAEASENLEFEKAAKIRDRINAIKSLKQKQKVVSNKVLEQDIISSVTDGKTTVFQVFRIKGGRLYDSEYFTFLYKNDNDFASTQSSENTTEANSEKSTELSEFIVQYYSIRTDIPKNVTIDRPLEDAPLLEDWLTKARGSRVYITSPQKGEQAHLVAMCQSNALEQLAQLKNSNVTEFGVLTQLQKLLGLQKIPEYIESYDISHTAGDENVAGMVVFKNGKPYKNAYRKFKIKTLAGQDDYGSMAEVLERRFNEYLNNAEGFSTLPDLILLDGGKGQVGAVVPVLNSLGIDVPLFGMVKDDKHRTRALTTAEQTVGIQNNRAIFTFISKIQDEVHRFAIGYHKQRRSKSAFKSSLTNIEGIGTERAKELLRHFKTIKNISNADLSELENAPKMNRNAAHSVYSYFHQEDNDADIDFKKED
ncbi:MAG: excinuclease ABC subunit UvrC [Oscillospiraceae bacterium]|jgi:excinuclease ABC subunit C|nr:excinuclease ABC subunit UvrC [Oscillospiraceae bacterium]